MVNRIKRSIKQLSITFLIVAFILSFFIILMEGVFFKYNTKKVALDNAVEKSKERENVINSFLEESKKHIFSLRDSIFFKNYLKDKKNKKYLANLLLTYAHSHNNFMELRYIDKSGNELIRINREKKDSKPFIVKTNKLQNKSHRYYFIKSKTKELEKVWFSKIDLTIENKKLQIPYLPTLRTILPIAKDSKFNGIIVINYYMESFIKKLTYAPLYSMILSNKRGNTIYHYKDKNFNKSWGNSLSHKYNISNDFIYEYKNILNSSLLRTNKFVSKKLDTQICDGLYLILQLKESYILEYQKGNILKYVSIFFVIFLLSIIITLFIVKFFSKTLLNLDELKKLNNSLNTASKVAKIAFWEFDAKESKISWSDGVYDIFDINNRAIEMNYERFLTFLTKEDRKKVIFKFKKSIEEKKDYFVVHKIVTEKKEIKTVEERGKHYFNSNNVFIKTVGSIHDITKTIHINKKYKFLLQNSSDGIHILDEEGNLTQFSNSFAKNLGYTIEEAISLNVENWDVAIPKDKLKPKIKELIKNPKRFETKHIRKDGTIIDVEINTQGVEIDGKKYLYASQRDITDYKKAIETIKKQTYRDELTKLRNRKAYNEKIDELLEQFKRYNTPFSFIMFDIDFFKSINDNYGHQVGDEVLKDLAQVVVKNIRKNDYIFRVGGEEFIILLSETILEDAIISAQKIRVYIQTEVKTVKEREVTVSIGVTQIDKKDNVETIYKRADKYLYIAKESGRNIVISEEK